MRVSIVMYHYVRELRRSRFPEIKGLETELFREQIGYIKKHYNVIGGDTLMAAVEAGATEELPPTAALLTFDDGYIDHFTQVFPILRAEGITGCFFPPAKCILENQLLDVNRIHFLLASVADKRRIVDFIFQKLDEHRGRFGLREKDYYWKELAQANRFDSKDVVFIKRILQRELPEELRKSILRESFEKYVTSDEVSFAKELYMSTEQITCLSENGMYIGSHGYNHDWLDTYEREEQVQEVRRAVEFLRRIGAPTEGWMMCYPYGAYNDSLLSILNDWGCRIGLTTNVAIADLGRDDLLTLPRLDTNDLPTSRNAKPNGWTRQARET